MTLLPKPSFLPAKPQVTPPSPDSLTDMDKFHQSGAYTWLDSSSTAPTPMRKVASTVNLVNLGVGLGGIGIGPGINPNISTASLATGQDAVTNANNPPIVNTGNNGPMCVQPGDWMCSSCGFVNWRRRRVCMRCFPFADSNELSQSIANGALLAAQLAAGNGSIPAQTTSSASNLSNLNPISVSTIPLKDAVSSAPSTSRSFATLPPRPDLGSRSNTLYKTATTSNWAALDFSSEVGKEDDINNCADQLQRVLQLQGKIPASPIQYSANATTTSTSSSLLLQQQDGISSNASIFSRDALIRSPSVPALSTYSGTISPSIRNIWQSPVSLDQLNPSSNITTISSSLSSLLPPSTTTTTTTTLMSGATQMPTYRPYKPTTIFGQSPSSEVSTPSTTPTGIPYNHDIWRSSKGLFATSLSQLPISAPSKTNINGAGSSGNSKSSSSSSSIEDASYFEVGKKQSNIL